MLIFLVDFKLLDSKYLGFLSSCEFKHITQCLTHKMVSSSSPSHSVSILLLILSPAPPVFLFIVSFLLMNIRSMESETLANSRFPLNIYLKIRNECVVNIY